MVQEFLHAGRGDGRLVTANITGQNPLIDFKNL
jgi:hypothetical protein